MQPTSTPNSPVVSPAFESILDVAPYQTGKPIEELTREYEVTDVVKLASNESPMGCSPHVTLAITQQLGQLSRYPDNDGYELKQTLADFTQTLITGITLGNGSNDLLGMLARSFVSSDDAVVYSQYAFVMYGMLTKLQGAQAIEVPAQRYGHDLEAMLAAVKANANTKMVFIANPNNPTGTLLTKEALYDFISALPSSVLVVLDEAYIEYSPESDNRALLDDFDNVVIVRTFSKAYGLAGLRVGYALSSEAVATVLNRVRQPFNVNRLALAAAKTALLDKDFIKRAYQNNKEQMRWLEKQFDALGLAFIRSSSNFIMVEITDALAVYHALLEQGVIVRPLVSYGLAGWLRITVGLPEDNLRLIDTLSYILNNDSA